MNASTFFLCATFVSVLYLSRAFPQYPNDGNFLFDADFDFQGFILPSKTTAKIPIRAGKPRSPIIANVNQQNTVTPVPILKQINRHNENGSYTYGFESADGSFKIETKLATGEVIGKYGYVDDRGKLRVVEYGANKYGFQPAGEGITIPPITIANDTDPSRLADNVDVGHYASRPEVVRILSKSTNPKRKSHKPIPSSVKTQQQPTPPQYSVQESDESARVETGRPIITAADINALQFIYTNDAHELRDNPTLQAPPRKFASPPPQRFEEHALRENDRPPFMASFPYPAIFDVIPLPSNDFPQSRSHQAPFDLSSKLASQSSSKNPRNRAKPKLNPQLVLVTPIEETPSPVRRSSNGARTVHQGRSILDELVKQYAIPNGSPAISDFSFSYNTK